VLAVYDETRRSATSAGLREIALDAIRDGHHRVSVAKALGAPTIRAVVA
jgi:uncharacterized protein (DUF1015 family)